MNRTALASILLVTTLLSGCAAAQTPAPEVSLGDSPILTKQLSDSVTAFGVVLAAVLITSGDVEKALAEGLVTPEEIQEAQKAIQDGQVDLWRQRAEMDK